MGFTGRDLMVATGYHRYGEDFAKALTPVYSGHHGSRRILEPFPGAWQQNVEEKRCDLLCYPTLYACLDRISSDMGLMPFKLQKLQDNGIWVDDNANTSYNPVLRKQNRYQTAQQFREYWLISKLTDGNTYVLKERDARGVVVRLYILDPCAVMPMVTESGDVYYQLMFSRADNLLPQQYPATQVIVPASEIIHDRMNCFHHQLIGVPPLCAAYWPALKNLKILKDSTNYFANGARPSGILTAPAGMSDEDAEAVKAYWNQNFTGENSGKVGLIGADLKFTPFSFTSADAQLVAQMEYSDAQICQPFGIPPYIIGKGTLPAGLKVDDLFNIYLRTALQKHIEAMENLLEEGLGVTMPQGIDMDTEPLLRMDFQKRAEVWGGMVGNGLATPNEGRLPFNLPPLEGGDTVYLQQQDYPLDQVAQNKIAQANPAPVEPAAPEAAQPEDDQEDEEARALAAELFMTRAFAAAHAEIAR